MILKIIKMILYITIFAFISCDSSSKFENLDFFNTIWTLQYFNVKGEVVKLSEGQVYTIQFETDSTFSGINHCNDLSGSYQLLSESKINVLNAGGSKLHCGDSSLFLDYLSALQSAETYKISDDQLSIFYGNNSNLIYNGE